jgi:glycosyltransferase involved in cell wall biosynthesis
MNAPRCAVVIPANNCLGYLREALASVAMQDVPDLEVIVVDDGSSDGTAE